MPRIFCDPLASLAPADICIDLAGHRWQVNAMTADGWLHILWADPFDPDDIFPGLAGAGDDVFEAILDGKTTFDEIFTVAMEVLEEAAGFRWWFTLRLASAMKAQWPRLGGLLLLSGIKPDQVSLGALLSSAYALSLEHMTASGAYKFINALNDPPAGFGEPLDEAAEAEAFLAAMSAPY